MKFTLAFIALFVLAANAAWTVDIDPVKAYGGFSMELKLNQTVNTDFTQCATAFGKIQKDLQTSKINTFADAWGSWINTMLGSEAGYNSFVNTIYSITVDGPCNRWTHAVLFTLLSGTGDIESNLYNHSNALIAKGAQMRDQYLALQHIPFGKSVGSVLKIVFGVEHPPAYKDFLKALGNPKPTTADINVEIQKFINLVATGWNLKSQVTLDVVKKIWTPIDAQLKAFTKYEAAFFGTKNMLEREGIFMNGMKSFGMSFRPIMSDVLAAGQPFIKELKMSQTGFETLVNNIVHNFFTNFQSISETGTKLIVQLQAGAPEEAAATFLAMAKTLQ